MVRLFSLRPMRFAWIAACLHATYAQTSDFDTSVDQFPVKTTIDQDVKPLFSVEYHNWYKVVTNHAVNQKYALVCCGQTPESDLYDAVVPVPVQSVGVDGALPVLPFLDLLGQQDVVHFIQGIANVTSPCYDTVEKDDGDADVVFLSRQAPPRANGVVFSATDPQLSPLQQAAWVAYASLFFNNEDQAEKLYEKVKTQYDCHRANMAHAMTRPAIAWTAYDQGEWSMHDDTFYQQLAADAGTTLVSPSAPIQFHENVHAADVVIDQSTINPADFDEWLRVGDFVPGTISFDQPFLHHKTVYRLDGLVDDLGFQDWKQRAAARPDLALTDLIHVAHPLYDRTYHFEWLRNVAKGDHARELTEATYDCRQPLSTLSVCTQRADWDNALPSSPGQQDGPDYRHSGNVGIILGILLTSGVLVAGILYYRHWQRQSKVEYFPLSNF